MNLTSKNIFFIIMLAGPLKIFAQNVTSPYSILGIGDIENDDYGRYAATGSASVARRAANGFYNFSNPASLTQMNFKSINLDFESRGKITSFKTPGIDASTASSKDFIIKRITLAFKSGTKTGIAFGLKPYSSVNYQFNVANSLNNEDAQYTKYTSGSGGMYDVYFSVAREINPRLSLGVTSTWRFGSIEKDVNYYNASYGLDITRSENRFYYGAGLVTGLQYYSLLGKKWQHFAGITLGLNTNLNGQTTTTYSSVDSTIQKNVANSEAFKMPVSLSAGYSIANNKGWQFNSQFIFDKWPSQKLSYTNSATINAMGIRAGLEYSKKVQVNRYQIEDYYIGFGGKIDQSYLLINSNKLTNYALTFGGGKNVSRFISVNGNIEIGKRGQASLGQIRENYTQFSLGFTLKDFWAGTKHFGRFD